MMILPRFRKNVTTAPSPDVQRPGLYIRDHYKYSDAWLIIPPSLVSGLAFFDGVRTDLDLQAEVYLRLRETRHQEFAQKMVRSPAHAGSAYPNNREQLRDMMQKYLEGPSLPVKGAIGIAAPHVSLVGGWQSYRAAYNTLTPDLCDRTFIVLGTSHFGTPNKFGMTRKPFETPLGTTSVNNMLLDELMSEPAVSNEDYCHAIEHSIEMQIIFLQTLYGSSVRILPVLCGHFAKSIYQGGLPEDDDAVRRFFGKLGDIAAREVKNLFWVMGIDMAHMGGRYGDRLTALADQNEMMGVRQRDLARIQQINSGNIRGYWDRVQEKQDDLKWCGSSPLYTFMKAVPQARGTLQRYEQWNIDASSIVSFAGLSFAG